MKKRILTIISTITMALVLFVSPLLATNINTTVQKEQVQQTRTISADQSMKFEHYYNQMQEKCEEVKFDYDEEYNQFSLTATQKIPIKVLEEIDNTAISNEEESLLVTYNTTYDPELNLVTLFVYSNGEISDALVGCPFTKEDGEVDVVFCVDDELIYLSELQDTGVIQNCGWFSRICRKVVKYAAVVAVAAAIVTVAAVVTPVLVTAVTTVVAGVSGGVAVLSSTAGVTAALNAGAMAIASTTSTIAATAAVVAGMAAVAGEIDDNYQIIDNQIGNLKNKVKVLTTAITVTVAEIKLDRKYYFAYLTNVLNINYNTPLNYLEAYFVLLETGLINSTALGKFNGYFKNIEFSKNVKNLIENIKSNNKIKQNYFGIYASREEDAAKLAYAAGGFFNGLEQSEIHNSTKGSGYYYHFHDFSHSIHVWYGNPA